MFLYKIIMPKIVILTKNLTQQKAISFLNKNDLPIENQHLLAFFIKNMAEIYLPLKRKNASVLPSLIGLQIR